MPEIRTQTGQFGSSIGIAPSRTKEYRLRKQREQRARDNADPVRHKLHKLSAILYARRVSAKFAGSRIAYWRTKLTARLEDCKKIEQQIEEIKKCLPKS